MTASWSWEFTAEILPELLQGLVITVEAVLFGTIIAFVLGLILAILRRSEIRLVNTPTRWVIEFIRSTPLLVQLYFLYFTLGSYEALQLPALATGVIGLGLHYSTYAAEVYRAGIEGVPQGQWEAATALNLPRLRVWTGVVLPQAIPRVIPALGNYVISMFKETPLLSAIAVVGLVGAADIEASQAYRYVEPLTLAGLFFLAVSYPSSVFVRFLERRLGH